MKSVGGLFKRVMTIDMACKEKILDREEIINFYKSINVCY